jgi:hypothetical protein
MDARRHFNPIERITREIHDLSEQQTEAMCSATFAGMTEHEVQEFELRRIRIIRLVKQLSAFKKTRWTPRRSVTRRRLS